MTASKSPHSAKPKAILVTPDVRLREGIIEQLSARVTIEGFSTYEEAREEALAATTDAVIVADTCGPDGDGLSFLMEVRDLHPEKGTILISSRVTTGLLTRAESIGVTRILVPPVSPAVVFVVANALEHRRLHRQIENSESVIAELRSRTMALNAREAELMASLSAAETARIRAEEKLALKEAGNPPAPQP